MDRDALVMGIAAVFAGVAVVMSVLALSSSLFLFVVAVPFGVAAYLLWDHASGRMAERVRSRRGRRTRRRGAAEGPRGPGSRFGREARQRARAAGGARERAGAGGRAGSPAGGAGMSRPEAYSELDLSPDASGEDVKRAYRERVKETHPDSGGDEEEFKRVTSAYETLTE